jgi:hypothetical protein
MTINSIILEETKKFKIWEKEFEKLFETHNNIFEIVFLKIKKVIFKAISRLVFDCNNKD